MGLDFVDRCSLLVLHCSHRASCWHFADALPPTPLDDTFAPSRRNSQPAHKHQRKKDLPDPTDRVGISRLVTSHSLQKTMVQQRSSGAQHRSVTLIASSLRAVEGNRHPWSAPAGWQPLPAAQRAAVLKSGGDFEALDRPMRHPRRRVVLDEVATPQECHALIQVAEAAMTEGGGETVLICSPPTELREEVGEAAARLVAMLCWRVQAAVAAEFDEARTLYLAGAMLTRTRPPATSRAGGGRAREAAGGPPSGEAAPYDYGAPHVDRANMSSYDYSAVLYVNTKATGAHPGGAARRRVRRTAASTAATLRLWTSSWMRSSSRAPGGCSCSRAALSICTACNTSRGARASSSRAGLRATLRRGTRSRRRSAS